MKNKFSFIVLFAVVLLLLSGCKTNAPVYYDEVPLFPAKTSFKLEKTIEYSDIRFESTPSFLSLGNGKLISYYTIWENKDNFDWENDTPIYSTKLAVIDTVKNEVIREKTLSGNFSLDNHIFAGYKFIISDENSNYYVYNSELELTDKITLDSLFGVFSYDLTKYYIVDEGVFSYLDIETREIIPIEKYIDMRFSYVFYSSYDSNYIILSTYKSCYSSETFTAIYDVKSNEISLITDDLDYIWFRLNDYGANTFDNDYGTYLYGIENYGEKKSAIRYITNKNLIERGLDYLPISDSDFMILGYADYEEDYMNTMPSSSLVHMSDISQKVNLEKYDMEYALFSAYYMREESIIAGVTFDEGTDKYRLVLIDTTQLEYDEEIESSLSDNTNSYEPELFNSYADSLNYTDASDILYDLNGKVDELEEKYSVTIKIGNDVKQPLEDGGFEFAVNEDYDNISASLYILDNTLGLYPDGFFKEFKTKYGDGGVWFMLIGKIDSTYSVVGYHFPRSNCYNIAVDTTSSDLKSVLCHEIWHAIEAKISDEDYEAFMIEKWSKLNPEGFVYSEVYESYAQDNLSKWTYWYENDKSDVYFIDEYSRTYDKEDRARIMEFAMASLFPEDYFNECPHLKAKLDYMIKCVREHFTSDNWNDVIWEKYQ